MAQPSRPKECLVCRGLCCFPGTAISMVQETIKLLAYNSAALRKQAQGVVRITVPENVFGCFVVVCFVLHSMRRVCL